MQRALIIAAVLALFPASAFAKFDPSFTWSTIETPHFLVHFHQGGEEIARHAAAIAEDVHDRLVPRMRWEPKERTRIVLVDAMDESNGMTTPIPYNEIVLFLTRPAGAPGFGTLSYDEWLRLLITHEYTHVLHLDMVNGGPKVLQHVLGRIYFPNMFQPIWMLEGLATYEETEQTSGGRGRSPGAEMIIRTAVLENAFPDLSQAAIFPDSWPSGDVPYLFGEGFTRFIAGKFGRERLAEVSVAYSGRWFPLLVGSTGERVLHESYQDLWNEWQWSLEKRYGKLRAELTAKGLTSSVRLTDKGFVTTSPAFSPDGSRIAFAAVEGDEFPGIYVMDADGKHQEKLVENVFPVSSSGMGLAWSADGSRIYYTKIEIVRNTDYYDDLYYYDLAKRREVRLTKGIRGRDPAPSPDGSKLLFVMNRMGRTRLCSLDLSADRRGTAREADVVPLTEWGDDQYETPRWSPDGGRIAVGLWQAGGFRDIHILDPAGQTVDEVTHDRAIDVGPAWSADGRFLYFSSDRTGIFDLYAYEPGTKALWQITNVLSGAFAPAPSPDNTTLAFAYYSSRGYDIHTLRNDPASWRPAVPAGERYPSVQYAALRPVESTARPYSPLSTIYPRFWLPWFGSSPESGTLYGALTFGQDAVQRHQYLATVLYGPKRNRTWYSFDYLYDGFYPTVELQATDTDVTYSGFLKDPTDEKQYTERERTVGASLIIPLYRTARQHVLILGYQRRDLEHLTDLPPWPGYTGPLPAEGDLVSGRAAYLYNDARRYAFSISPEDGRTIELGTERFLPQWGSDFDFTKYTADWHEYLPLPFDHHVLLARMFVGTSTGEAPPQGAYHLGGDSPGDVLLTTEDRDVTLRGYPTNVMRGRKAAFGGLEYRFPISLPERGWNTKPFYYSKLHGAVFGEAGNAWDEKFQYLDTRRSVGAEVRLDMLFAYYVPLTIRFVLTRGLDEKGETQLYLGLWVPMGL